MVSKKYQFEFDEDELTELKQLLKKLETKEPKIEVKVNGYVRSFAKSMTKAILEQEEFYKYDRW
ncbi:MAG TPA: hypothetical protein DHU63_06170 [Candidatus Marinimicrobia bacterium]|nr:MAG: hypothetical protein AUJ47_11460 [Candidatus Marinimicrobia bacterium CG1_02_48_14]PIZ64919.1 MAG: hypothetical protein COY19_08530 [Candidatus Marinimicrobia bacterium CG_4_10_14_0_2_um_filter_48_9]PJA53128.1 MAG: hypothetical protein CO167_08040 [Candidatus Marinimicrobia bacterium CG_4_9_14_3_um_filter_48_9]HCW76108.1 hypothetical protein [Candidatus Neomarinimicrobiota bacterium]